MQLIFLLVSVADKQNTFHNNKNNTFQQISTPCCRSDPSLLPATPPTFPPTFPSAFILKRDFFCAEGRRITFFV